MMSSVLFVDICNDLTCYFYHSFDRLFPSLTRPSPLLQREARKKKCGGGADRWRKYLQYFGSGYGQKLIDSTFSFRTS